MRAISLPYSVTGRFAQVVLDHLAQASRLDGLYAWPMDRAGIKEAIAARSFPEESRERLVRALERQYAGVELDAAVQQNLRTLGDPRSVTITTGHQLCLFTGPLYVPLKIMNTVRLARDLSTPERPVVPVFWMATEDHDRPEIDHVWFGARKLTWPGPVAGAVGRLPLEGIGAVLDELAPLLGYGTRAEELRALIRRCYRPEHTLAQATRLFVNALFGRFGVVVLDGDDAELKALFAPIMREESITQATERAVATTREQLKPYGEQAHARPINLFHLQAGSRTRIERLEGGFRVSEQGPLISEADLLQEIETHPEHFSPNVLLRPIYQETILPNVAYVGGGGEVAYWLQLRPVFERFNVPMPVVVLRTSIALLEERSAERMSELGLTFHNLFRPLEELRAQVARGHASFDTSLAVEEKEARDLYARLAERARHTDPTLEGAVAAIGQRALKALERLEGKFVRAAKREQHDLLARLETLHGQVFPGGSLQERRDNFMPYYLAHGAAFFDLLLELDPLTKRFTMLVDDLAR
ncbi:MAG: bacillithiol biosynthesis cysteine-adding enzyme BshC [Flavobacteriales bacterium]